MAGVTEATAERFVEALRKCDEDTVAALLSAHPELVETAPDEWYFNHPMALVGAVQHWGTPPVPAGRQLRMLEMLLRMGCTVPTHTIGGTNFLHALCRSSATYPCDFKVKFFVENGLGVNERSATGHTPLYYAVMQDNPALVRALILCGADMEMLVSKSNRMATIFEHSNLGRLRNARRMLEKFTAWNPRKHKEFPPEAQEAVEHLVLIHRFARYEDEQCTRLHDLPRELLFEIIALSMASANDGELAASSGSVTLVSSGFDLFHSDHDGGSDEELLRWARGVDEANEAIRPCAAVTPLLYSPWLSEQCKARVYLKCEHMQHTGSFKLRGATNALRSLRVREHDAGHPTLLYAASTGNHGQAVAMAAQQLGGFKVVVFVPEGAASTKVNGMRRLGAEVQYHGTNCVEAEEHARFSASRDGAVFVSPYNDDLVIKGQGTVACECEMQLEEMGERAMEVVVASVGGGGLLSGIAVRAKAGNSLVHVMGVQPHNSRVMMESVKAGRILFDVEERDTLSTGTAGGLEAECITFPLMRYVDEFVDVGEEAIKEALRGIAREEHMIVEGAAAVAVAGVLQRREALAGKVVVVVLCGKNIDHDTLMEVLNEHG